MITAQNYRVISPGKGELFAQQPPEPGPNQLLVRVLSNGVCASDLPVWAREQRAYPITIGHEPVGLVEATGPGVTVPVGSLVGGRIGDSFANYALADAEDTVLLPDSVDPLTALPEPVGCVVEGYRRTHIPVGASVAVVGLGFMGLIMLQLLRSSPVSRIYAIDLRDDALATALRNGADLVFAPADVPTGLHFGERGGPSDGVDVVIEASGSQSGLDLASSLVRPQGVVSVLGYHQGPRQIQMQEWNWKALEVINAHVRDRRLLRDATVAGLQLQGARRLDIASLVTHRFSPARIDAAFETLRDKPHGFIKSIVDFA